MMLVAACGSNGDPIQVSNSGAGAFEASLATTDNGYIAAWYDVRDGNAEIYFRLMTAEGQPAERERRLTSTPADSYEADVQAVGSNVAVSWYEKAADGKLQAMLGMWSRDGRQLWARTISSPDRNGRNAIVTAHGAGLFVAWIEDSGTDASDVWAGWWNVAGDPVRPAVRVAPAGRTTWNLNTDVDAEGRGWIAFDAKAGTKSDELFLARVDESGVNVHQLTADDGIASKYPDLALNHDRAALTWYDERDGNQEVYLSVGPVESLVEPGTEARARRVTNTPGHSIGAYVAWNGDTAGLAWCDDSTGGQHEIYFQPFGPDGQPRAAARRLTNNPTSSLVPSLRAARGRFALAWNEYAAPAGDGHGSTGRSEIAFTVVQ